ncbi:hypothetical protein [Variovorax sp. RCC_210]|uniref:hypothetical protein n=1 Tax=Variovorax sp. RCC_210 TaxID=3239217 RepID=UPI0035247A17
MSKHNSSTRKNGNAKDDRASLAGTVACANQMLSLCKTEKFSLTDLGLHLLLSGHGGQLDRLIEMASPSEFGLACEILMRTATLKGGDLSEVAYFHAEYAEGGGIQVEVVGLRHSAKDVQ